MRTTRFGEPSDKEIDALRQPPICPGCNQLTDNYGELCSICQLELDEPDLASNLIQSGGNLATIASENR